MKKRSKFHQEQDRLLLEFMGLDVPYRRPAAKWSATPDRSKILVLADPHNPYASVPVCRAVEAREKDAALVVVPGDVGDYYSKSRFRKTRAVALRDEVRGVFFYIEWLATHWPRVKLMLGNHDNRPEKKIAAMLGDDIELAIMTEQNLLANLASFFDNVEVVGTQISGAPQDNGRRFRIGLTHIYQHGDIVFTHGEKSAEQASALMGKISMYLHQWKGMLGLRDYRIIAQAHNHADFRQSAGQERWIQLPAACDPVSAGMEYIYGSRMIGRPPATGYAVFFQSAGETDYNASRNVLI